VLGHDLTGLGAHPGDYEPNTTQHATSPVINASTLANGQLKFRRWLNVGGGAVSTIQVKQGSSWFDVYNSNSFLGNTETAWSLQTLNISAFADGNSALQIRFRQQGGFSSTANRSGWNVDRFIVKTGNTPDFDACGACGGAPTFAGLGSAADADPCADTGVNLAWDAAPAWGTGHAGSYSVYRDTSPSFTPSSANRIAVGVTGTSYTDTGAPDGVTLFYVVRAENDETCSSGPANGGVTDSNLDRLSARDDLSQPPPGSLGGSLEVNPNNDVHVRLTWSPATDAARYHVYRSQSAQGPYTQIADVAETLYEDRNQMVNTPSLYYKVLAADACGSEGP
jgi:hypothetical protein